MKYILNEYIFRIERKAEWIFKIRLKIITTRKKKKVPYLDTEKN